MIVVALALRDSLDLLTTLPPEPGHASSDAAVRVLYDQIRLIVIVTALLSRSVRSTRSSSRRSRLGTVLGAARSAARQETVVSSIVSQVGACALALTLGIPLGLGLWRLMEGGDLPETSVSPTAHLLVAALVPIVFAAVVSIPARGLARRSIAPLLTYE